MFASVQPKCWCLQHQPCLLGLHFSFVMQLYLGVLDAASASSNVLLSSTFPVSSTPYLSCCSFEKVMLVQWPMSFSGPAGVTPFRIHHGAVALPGSPSSAPGASEMSSSATGAVNAASNCFLSNTVPSSSIPYFAC